MEPGKQCPELIVIAYPVDHVHDMILIGAERHHRIARRSQIIKGAFLPSAPLVRRNLSKIGCGKNHYRWSIHRLTPEAPRHMIWLRAKTSGTCFRCNPWSPLLSLRGFFLQRCSEDSYSVHPRRQRHGRRYRSNRSNLEKHREKARMRNRTSTKVGCLKPKAVKIS